MNLIETLEKEEIARLSEGKTFPQINPGDTVVVNVNVVEGSRKRVQAFEGVVIAKRNRGLNSAFTVRKISSGEGVERTFQLYSPMIASIEVKRHGDVRRAKLYYLRNLSGKDARIKEKLVRKAYAEDMGGPSESGGPRKSSEQIRAFSLSGRDKKRPPIGRSKYFKLWIICKAASLG